MNNTDDRIIQLLRKGYEVEEYLEDENGNLFFTDGIFWYVAKSKKQGLEVVRLCGYYRIEKILKADKLKYEIYSGGLERTVRIERFSFETCGCI